MQYAVVLTTLWVLLLRKPLLGTAELQHFNLLESPVLRQEWSLSASSKEEEDNAGNDDERSDGQQRRGPFKTLHHTRTQQKEQSETASEPARSMAERAKTDTLERGNSTTVSGTPSPIDNIETLAIGNSITSEAEAKAEGLSSTDIARGQFAAPSTASPDSTVPGAPSGTSIATASAGLAGLVLFGAGVFEFGRRAFKDDRTGLEPVTTCDLDAQPIGNNEFVPPPPPSPPPPPESSAIEVHRSDRALRRNRSFDLDEDGDDSGDIAARA